MGKTVTKADIVDALYFSASCNHVQLKSIVDKIFDKIKTGIKQDGSVLISGFGKFECNDKASRLGRNPQTEETIVLPARKVVAFRVSRKFRNALNEKPEE